MLIKSDNRADEDARPIYPFARMTVVCAMKCANKRCLINTYY